MAYQGREGVGGWLAALIVVIGVVAPLFYGYFIWYALDAQATLRRYGAESMPVWSDLTAIWMLSLVKLAIAWSIAGAMLRFRTPAVIRFAIAGIWILAVGMVFADWLWLGDALETPLWRIAIFLGVGLVLAIPATLYLLRSKRVANTYRRAQPAEGLGELFE
jgi:hypothetical protein